MVRNAKEKHISLSQNLNGKLQLSPKIEPKFKAKLKDKAQGKSGGPAVAHNHHSTVMNTHRNSLAKATDCSPGEKLLLSSNVKKFEVPHHSINTKDHITFSKLL